MDSIIAFQQFLDRMTKLSESHLRVAEALLEVAEKLSSLSKRKTNKKKKIQKLEEPISLNSISYGQLEELALGLPKKARIQIIERRPFQNWKEVEKIRGIGKYRIRQMQAIGLYLP
jgi:DNA uptake protein ComE-like DNA-binding protein